MNDKFYAIETGGVVTIHMHHPTGDYATLCGLDGDDPDPSVDQVTVDVPKGAKVTCSDCIAIYEMAKQYKKSDIDYRFKINNG